MLRRAFLATAGGVASAGCAGSPSANLFGGDDATDRQPYDVEEPLDPSLPDVRDGDSIRTGPARITTTARERTIVLPEVPFMRGSGGLEYAYGFDHPGSRDAPPILRIAATNTRPTARELTLGPTPPFSGYVGSNDEGARLLLLPVEPGMPGSFDGQCWRVDESAVPATADGRTVELDTGEAVSERYALFVPRDASECLELGQYRFQNPANEWTLRLNVWDAAEIAPGPSRFEDATVPSLPNGPAVDWYHEAGRDAHVYVEPSTESVTLPGGELSFAFRNYGSGLVTTDPTGRGLYELRDGEWSSIEESARTWNAELISPGETERVAYEIGAEAPAVADDDDAIGGLSPGVYAYAHGAVHRGVGRLEIDWRPAALFEVREGEAGGDEADGDDEAEDDAADE